MKKCRILIFGILVSMLLPLLCSKAALAHCQVPCGIYNDQMRIDMIDEKSKKA
jgi:hypothetical protein